MEPYADVDEINTQLEQICSHRLFARADARKRLLSFLVQEYVARNTNGFTEYDLVHQVLKPHQRTQSDLIDDNELANLRQQMATLRRNLDLYYSDAGRSDELLIDVPMSGGSGYRVTVSRRPRREVSPESSQEAKRIPLTTFDDFPQIERLRPTDPVWRLMNPRLRAVEFTAHQTDRHALFDWADNDAPVSCQAVYGHGGRGKTRLAIQLLEDLQTQSPKKWHAGFLDEPLSPEAFYQYRATEPTLVVIDDASQWADILAERVIPAVQDIQDRHLRFLLIDRGADETNGWYRRIHTAARSLFPKPPLHVRELDHQSESGFADRRHFLDKALKRVSGFLGKTRLAINAVTAEGLRNPEMGDPSVLFMAAIVATEIGDLSPLAWRRIDLADYLADREEQRVALLAKPALLPLHLTAYVCLSGGLSSILFT
jgi:hypothetical protein